MKSNENKQIPETSVPNAEVRCGGTPSSVPICSPSSFLGDGSDIRGSSQMERFFWAYLETKIQQIEAFTPKKQKLLKIIESDLPENLNPIVYEAILAAI